MNNEQLNDDRLKWKTLSSEYLSHETWFTVRKDTCERSDGTIINNYYVFEFPEWATAFPVTAEGKIVLTKQYRHALNEVGIELPGGVVEKGESFEDGIKRELLEETGYEFDEIKPLGVISANPSTNTNLMHMFLATGGRKIKEQALDDNEEIEILELSFDELMQLIDENKIMQSMHLSTIYYALKSLGKLSYK
ncbi:MAG TPA: NUDIX hydrolase [Parafilimonas sp.]|nr:NUDIX hydrolase [Parafilimonas sp.]